MSPPNRDSPLATRDLYPAVWTSTPAAEDLYPASWTCGLATSHRRPRWLSEGKRVKAFSLALPLVGALSSQRLPLPSLARLLPEVSEAGL